MLAEAFRVSGMVVTLWSLSLKGLMDIGWLGPDGDCWSDWSGWSGCDALLQLPSR